MYSKCGDLASARHAFNEMPLRDVVSYSAILGAHARLGDGMESTKGFFDGMHERNVISYNAKVVGYVNAWDLSVARAVFDAMPVRNVVSWTVMVIGYSKSGMMDTTRHLFDGMPNRNLVLWTVMITRYAQSRQPKEALAMFHGIERDGIEPDGAAMVGVIFACAQLGRIELVNWVASYVERKGIERNDRVLTALVDMHAKCGNVDEACRLFNEIHRKDAFSYAALINGISSHDGLRALRVFDRMVAEALKPVISHS